jgi:hypothetical protein
MEHLNTTKRSMVKFTVFASLLCVVFDSDTCSGQQPPQLPDVPKLLSPTDSAVAVEISPTLTWGASGGATSYTIQLSQSAAFDSAVVNDSTVALTTFTVSGYLANNTVYYWRVKAKNGAGSSAWSIAGSFTTDIERLVLLAPNGGETYHAGDTIPVSFEYRNRPDTAYFVTLWFSLDGGKSFDMPVLGARNTVRWDGSPRKDTVWIVPTDTTIFGNYITNQAKIRVEDYTKKATENDVSDQSFTVLSSNIISVKHGLQQRMQNKSPRLQTVYSEKGVMLSFPAGVEKNVQIINVQGKTIISLTLRNGTPEVISRKTAGNTLCFATWSDNGCRMVKKLNLAQ